MKGSSESDIKKVMVFCDFLFANCVNIKGKST